MFFKKKIEKQSNSQLIKIAALMIHAGKIDENFSQQEEMIIKKALLKGYVLNNLDITLLLETPKIYVYKNDMIENISKLFSESTPDEVINKDMFNIKASTSESLGYIGRGEGVTCYCVVSLREI